MGLAISWAKQARFPYFLALHAGHRDPGLLAISISNWPRATSLFCPRCPSTAMPPTAPGREPVAPRRFPTAPMKVGAPGVGAPGTGAPIRPPRRQRGAAGGPSAEAVASAPLGPNPAPFLAAQFAGAPSRRSGVRRLAAFGCRRADHPDRGEGDALMSVLTVRHRTMKLMQRSRPWAISSRPVLRKPGQPIKLTLASRRPAGRERRHRRQPVLHLMALTLEPSVEPVMSSSPAAWTGPSRLNQRMCRSRPRRRARPGSSAPASSRPAGAEGVPVEIMSG